FVPIEDIDDILIEINSNAYIDVGYISFEDQKIEMYKKISLINDEDDALDVQDELMDRFGMMPQEVLTLINVALIKAYAQKNGFSFVQEKKDSFVLKYRKHHKIDMDKLGKTIGEVDGKVLFSAGSEPYIIYKCKDNKEEKRLIEVLNLLKKL
ncbi:MAG TPA: TRCF domain-containing protein, partial [Clostridia bacterium]|nr:TRCF domain-containing protein [Clostridia bacterium]